MIDPSDHPESELWTPYEIKSTTVSGVKHDQEKLPYHLIPPELLQATADILAFGAKKYSARNWEAGMDWSRVYAALQRHMWAWWGGENLDPETGKSHLWHAATNIAFLLAFEARGLGADDRPKND
jgi:hypothetical protein